MKNSRSFLLLLPFLISSSVLAAGNGIVLSKLTFEGECRTVDKPLAIAAGAESITGALTALVAEVVVSEGFSFVADWLSSFKDSYKGIDSATLSDAFYCSKKPPVRQFGIRKFLVYERSRKEGDSTKSLIRVKSRLDYIVTDAKKPEGTFSLTPVEIDYVEPIAKRGSKKDLTITYTFEFLEKEGKKKSLALDPIVFEGIEKGSKYTELNTAMNTPTVGSLPNQLPIVEYSDKKDYSKQGILYLQTPFKVSIQVAETSVGKGTELAGNIAKSISESINADKDELTKKILDDWFDIKKSDSVNESNSSDKKQKQLGDSCPTIFSEWTRYQGRFPGGKPP